MARAVAAAPVVAEYLVPLLQTRRRSALLYRGQWERGGSTAAETGPAAVCRAQLSLNSQHCQLPADRGARHLIRLQPVSPRPQAVPTRGR